MKLLCSLDETDKPKIVHFALDPFMSYPNIAEKTNKPVKTSAFTSFSSNSLNLKSEPTHIIYPNFFRPCHRGIPIKIQQIQGNKYHDECLCPPSYYGRKCEYQNQRISLTIGFQTEMEWRTVFAIAITLIDSEFTVHSFEQLNYLPIRDCGAKFTLYLLYKSRPKNQSNQYFVRIDAFVANTSEYRASWLYPIQFSFLPVHRISMQITIPYIQLKNSDSTTCSSHGISMRYVNNEQPFCHCKSGWRGSRCDIKYECYCSSDSFCMGSSTSCLCPLYKFGSQCYLQHVVCRQNSSDISKTCLNDGLCVPIDIRFINFPRKFTCVCPEDHSGDLCQHNSSRIAITFGKEFNRLSTSILIHFITADGNKAHKQITQFSKINFDQTVVIFHTSIAFHIIFAEVNRNYYLIYLQPHYQPSRIIKTEIVSTHQCLHINDLFDSIIINYHPLRRAKFYHKPCREHLNLQCFYDSDTFMCLCDSERKANCFNFDYKISHNCYGNNYCMNDGECFTDSAECPTANMCICKNCFYGSRCQFSTRGFNPSLDVILGYHIRPHAGLSRQTTVVKTSFGLMILLFIVGLISVVFSIITFQAKNSKEIGCGIYLLATSITSLLVTFAFALKFLLLFFIQYGLIVKPWIVMSNCVSMEFLLRILLNIGDWLNASVGMERIFIATMGIKFNKDKSRRVCKR